MRSPRDSARVRLPKVPRALRWLGSLHVAVSLLVLIAVVLAWGTLYETRFGTASVQRFIYRAWWFQAILGFLAVNLAVAAFERYPWKRQHLPFVMAHLGIILILLGGILGGRFGIEGQLIIREGESQRSLQLPTNVLVVHEPNPGVHHTFPTRFETTAWNHEPRALFHVPLKDRMIQLVVDRYYPDADVVEEVRQDGEADNPAIHLVIAHGEQRDETWLFARDPERFGLRWGEAHLLFLEPEGEGQLRQLLEPGMSSETPRGIVSIRFNDHAETHEIPVPEEMGQSIPVKGTPYTVTFKGYFPDFALSERGPISRSDEPNNPAAALTLSGPEGMDAYLLFALHPDFDVLHGREHTIPAQVTYRHVGASSLPPNAIAVIRLPEAGGLTAVLTGEAGQRERLKSVEVGKTYTHPWLGYEVQIEVDAPKARLTQQFYNKSDSVRAELLHVVAQDGNATDESWVWLRGTAELKVGEEPIRVEYAPAQRVLPVTIKLLDFRKIDYPGTQMAAGFESDVQLIDSERGVILMRKISMNNPLRYRGYSFFQSSFIPGEVETTVLSVRNDPGTPFVYAGFLIVIGGVVSMFVLRSRTDKPKRSTRGKGVYR